MAMAGVTWEILGCLLFFSADIYLLKIRLLLVGKHWILADLYGDQILIVNSLQEQICRTSNL